MYQVFSIQRPGHPKWALTASGLLLLLSIGLAWALIQSKSRGTYVPLEDRSRDYPAGGLRARLPAGWKPLDKKALTRLPAVVAGARAGDEPADGSVFVFRGGHRPYGLPSADAIDILHSAFGSSRQETDPRTEPAMIGPFFARTIRSAIKANPGASPESCLFARVAIAPDGQTFGILLLLPRMPTRHDETLLDEMSGHLELLDIALNEAPAALMADAGIRFDPPPKSKLVRPSPPPGPPPSHLRLLSTDKSACWYLHIWRTPLLGTRTCEQLVESLALTTLRQARLTDKPTKSTIAGREVVRADISPNEDAEPGSGVQIWCARMDGQTAVLLVGQHEANAANSLRDVCGSILEGVSLSGTDHILNAPVALQTGRQWLREVATEKLTSKWGDLIGHDQHFAFLGPSGTEFRLETSYEVAPKTNGLRRWRLVTTYSSPEPLAPAAPTLTDEWILRDDTAGHEGHIQRMTRSHPDGHVKYEESRPAGSNEVTCRLTVPQKESQEWTLAVDDSYVCQPILVEAAAKAARDPDRHIAVFSSSEEFNPHLSWVVATPLGELPVPGSQEGRTAAAVRLWTDYDGELETLYFDESDHVIAMSFDGGLRLEREGRSSKRDDSRSFFDRRQRP